MKQQEILQSLIPQFKADSSISAVMLMGSVAAGEQYSTSDLNIFILGNKNKFETEIIDGIMVERLYTTNESAISKLEKSGMEVYHYLGSKIIYDLDGSLLKLMRIAMKKYSNYVASEKDKVEIRHLLYRTKTKLNTALNNQNILKVDFMTATNSWKVIEAVFAVNNIPIPPAGRVIHELSNLKIIPNGEWFQLLFSKDTNQRTNMMLSVIDWILQYL